jgi:hypothetical protein
MVEFNEPVIEINLSMVHTYFICTHHTIVQWWLTLNLIGMIMVRSPAIMIEREFELFDARTDAEPD